MYSVEDLLISHGYKISSNNNVPPSHSSSSSIHEQRPPTRSNSRCEITDKRTGHGAANGYKADSVYDGGVKQTSVQCGPSDTEIRDKKQRTEEDNANIVDGHSPGGTLTSDSGFHDGHREMYSNLRPDRDASSWRRRGQDFNVLVDYTDIREPQGKKLGGPHKTEGMQRRPESALTTEEHRRERQRRADSARARERDLALYQWKMAAERKYQSLGTEEWRPAVGIGRHVSESEAEKWAQEQRRPRTAEGAVPPRTKAKSQSLPRMAMPSDSIQYLSMSSSGQDPFGGYRINGHQSGVPQGRSLSEGEGRGWTGNSRSDIQSAPPSKPRFSRPLRPPSYEVHQQMRGSSEMLSGDFVPRDRTPLPFSRQDYFAQELGGSGMEPPGYIPPPSYRRQPVIRGGHRIYANSMGNYQYRGDTYMQGPAMAEVQEWFMRQTGMAWPNNYRDGRRSMPCRRQAYPGYGEEHLGNVQYIPFDDPRVRHLSGGRMDGNSLTDADKIRSIRKDIPITSMSKKSPDDSAFLLTRKSFSSTEASNSNISDSVNEAVRHKEVSGEVINSKTTNDENSNRYPASPDYPNALQTSSQQKTSMDQQFCETVTQVKTFEAQTAAENKKNKKKIKETMFCLVSVPINMVVNKEATDPNNNEKVSSLVVLPTDNSMTQSCNKEMPKSANNNEQLIQSSSFLNTKKSKRAPLRKEIIDVWSLQANADKELCYAGSWPGEQYKNQETQTGSLEGSRNTNTQYPQTQVTHDPPSSTDSGLGTECSVNYKCPIKLQKNFSLSCNSAFAQTKMDSSSRIRSPVQFVTTSSPPSPNRQPPLRKNAPKLRSLNGQEAFGQFLLKPVNRRPWDAIGELESFNKELQDQNAKQKATDQAIEDLDEALRNILEVDNTNTEFIKPELATHRVKEPHSPEPQLKNENLDLRLDLEHRCVTQTSKEFREVGSALSTLTGSFVHRDIPSRQDVDGGFVNYEGLSMLQDDLSMGTLDIPVPKESLLKDVGLTVYTAFPDSVKLESPVGLSPESPMLTSPSDTSEACEAAHITSSDSGGDQNTNSPNISANHKYSNSNVCFVHKNVSENSKVNTDSGRSPHIYGVRRQHFTFMADYDDDDDVPYLINEKSIADEHLNALLSQEKANSMPTEDLSNLYQIQCAKGIPAHESIEQRAARILGIAVPVEALVVSQDCKQDQEDQHSDKQSKEKPEFVRQCMKLRSNEETQHVSKKYKQVIETSVHTHKLMEKSDTAIGEDRDSTGDTSTKESHTASLVLDLPEFPPNKMRLSLPVTEDEGLTLSVCGGEKKVTSAADLCEGQLDKSIIYHPSSVCRNGEASAERVNPVVEDESMSCVSAFKKAIQKGRGEEEMGEERTENRVQEDNILEGEEEQFVMNEMKVNEWQAAFEIKIDEDIDGKRDEEEETKEEVVERTIHSPESMGCSVSGPQSRSGTVVKREITLPDNFSMTTDSDSPEEEDIQSVSDSYDPSRVERV